MVGNFVVDCFNIFVESAVESSNLSFKSAAKFDNISLQLPKFVDDARVCVVDVVVAVCAHQQPHAVRHRVVHLTRGQVEHAVAPRGLRQRLLGLVGQT